jgi:hypothetical protein
MNPPRPELSAAMAAPNDTLRRIPASDCLLPVLVGWPASGNQREAP